MVLTKNKYDIEIDDEFNFWRVLSKPEFNSPSVLCLCLKCNETTRQVNCSLLQKNRSKSCGCDRSRKKDIINSALFGFWTVIDSKRVLGKVLCKCICLQEKRIKTDKLRNGGSKSCGCKTKELISKKGRKTHEDFVSRSKEIHGTKYDYGLQEYIGSRTSIQILCKIHGSFTQVPYAHLSGQGCPQCKNSKGEAQVSLYLERHNIEYVPQKTFPNCKVKRCLPFDFYIPSRNLLIEYDGKQHHGLTRFRGMTEQQALESHNRIQKYDAIKTKFAKDNNILLVRISYNDIVKEKLQEIFYE